MNAQISRRGFLCAVGIASASAALTACGGSSRSVSSVAGSAAASSEAASGESVELIVFAAASLTETLNAIAETYSAENPGVTFRFNFDSSGTLKTQIQEGADCDLFLSAGQKQMNQLDSTASAEVNTEGLDFVDSDSRVDLLENKVVLCVPENADKGIDSFDSLAEHLKAEDILFCMGNSDVPVGQYTQKILACYELDEAALAAAGVITYGSNVKEVTTQVSEASVDAGVVYCTDAFSAGLKVVDEATKEMCGQVIYPAAVLKTAPNAVAARKFLEYLQTSAAGEVFESVGIFFPFIIAAILKTAQGSSTVAITTTAGILGLYSAEGSLMSALGLTSPLAAALTVMAIGAGAMTVSHANDSYFWVVTNFGGMKAEDGYKTQTMCTLLMGIASIVFIWIISLFCH